MLVVGSFRKPLKVTLGTLRKPPKVTLGTFRKPHHARYIQKTPQKSGTAEDFLSILFN
jgi:hypothetical protein